MTTNVILATITAYCSCKICCGPNASGLTALGQAPIARTTVAAPRYVPLGSIVSICAHTYVAQDRTARRFDGRFDIYFATHKQAKAFGIKTNIVTIITP